MANLQSQIARMINKVEEYYPAFLAGRILERLNVFVRTQLSEQDKFLSPEEMEELERKVELVQMAESMEELDIYLLGYELMVEEMTGLKPEEFRFAAEARLRDIIKEGESITEKPEVKKKEGRVIKFPNGEKGRH